MAKRILFIHGRAPKPDKNDLQTLWFDAIQHGLLRDYGESRVQAFKQIEKRFIYYGDRFQRAARSANRRSAKSY